jgi:hypothetical protein
MRYASGTAELNGKKYRVSKVRQKALDLLNQHSQPVPPSVQVRQFWPPDQ